MPSNSGAERFINSHIGEIKKRDEPIVIDFQQPNGKYVKGSHVVVTFESYVTRADLKATLRQGVVLCTALCFGHVFGRDALSCSASTGGARYGSGGSIDVCGLSRDGTLAMMLGAKQGSEDDVDELFDSLDSDKSNSITRSEWQDFVSAKMQARMHRTQS